MAVVSERVRDRIGSIRACRNACLGMGLLTKATKGPFIREMVGMLDHLAATADELQHYLNGRAQFIERQVSLEEKLCRLGGEQLGQVAAMVGGSRPVFQQLGALSDPAVLSAVRDIAARVEAFDREGESKALGFNRQLRDIRRFGEMHTISSRYMGLLPDELDF